MPGARHLNMLVIRVRNTKVEDGTRAPGILNNKYLMLQKLIQPQGRELNAQ